MMSKTEKGAIWNAVRLMSRLCDDQTIAGLMNATLCVDQEDGLTDDQVEQGRLIFHALTEFRPDCIDIAINPQSKVGSYEG